VAEQPRRAAPLGRAASSWATRASRWTSTERRRAEDALRDADRRKDEFLACSRTRLRNPLTSIRASLFLLGRSALDARGRRTAATIERQVAHLARLIDDLLDATRISSRQDPPAARHLDLVALVRRALEDQRATLGRHRVTVESRGRAPVPVFADPARLAQIASNLLTPTPPSSRPGKGEIAVTVARGGRQGAAARRRRRGGPGRGDAEPLSFPFSQAERSLDRSKGGLGWGWPWSRGSAHSTAAPSGPRARGRAAARASPSSSPLDDRAA
jgi:K+-sensing histidine kinase KdpD